MNVNTKIAAGAVLGFGLGFLLKQLVSNNDDKIKKVSVNTKNPQTVVALKTTKIVTKTKTFENKSTKNTNRKNPTPPKKRHEVVVECHIAPESTPTITEEVTPVDTTSEMVQLEDVPVQTSIDQEVVSEVVIIEEPLMMINLPVGMRVVEAEVEDVQFLEPTLVEGVRKIVKTMLTMESGQVSLTFSWIGDMPIADYDGCVDAIYMALSAKQMNNQQLKRVGRTAGRAFPLNDVKIDIRRMS